MSDDSNPRLAERLTRAARAAQALSETLWEALHEELADPGAQRVAELSERLGEIATTVALLARVDAHAPQAPSEAAAPVEPGTVEPEYRVARVTHAQPPSDESSLSWEPSATQGPRSAAVLVDELAPAAPVRMAPGTETDRYGVETTETGLRSDDRAWGAAPEIEIRDVRGEEGPAAWIGSIGRRLERYEQEGSPFAVLLVELVDIERLRHAESSSEVARLTSRVQDALARELGAADSLTRERPGRYWLLAEQTDGRSVRMLAEQLARAVRSSASHRGTPLEVAVGVAVCPEDGRQISALAAHADVGLYAARAAGRSSVGG
jgi:GGDEF domain-containing protein